MKTWRWMLVMLSMGSLAAACTVETKKSSSSNNSSNSSSSSVVSSSSSSMTTSTTTTNMMTCGDLPTFGECLDCFCNDDPTGCDAFINAYINNFYCGAACGDVCTAFCADPSGNPSQPCLDCQDQFGEEPLPPDAETDVANYQSDCGMDSNCVGFVNTLGACP